MLLNCGVGEDSWESLGLQGDEIKSVNPNGNQSWIFIGRNDVESEAPVLWPSDVKSWLIWKDPDAGKDWGQKEKGTTEDEMVGWHHRLNGHGFGWTPGVGDGQGGLACCCPWSRKESDTTKWLDWTELSCSKPFYVFSLPSDANIKPVHGPWDPLSSPCHLSAVIPFDHLLLSIEPPFRTFHGPHASFLYVCTQQLSASNVPRWSQEHSA